MMSCTCYPARSFARPSLSQRDGKSPAAAPEGLLRSAPHLSRFLSWRRPRARRAQDALVGDCDVFLDRTVSTQCRWLVE